MNELNHFVVANPLQVPCTVRTLKPFWTAGELKPWVHMGELCEALQYLAVRSGLPDEQIRALKEQHVRLSSFIREKSGLPEAHQEAEPWAPVTEEQ